MGTVRITSRCMTEPLFSALANPAHRGTAELFWLGQAGFAIRSFNRLLVIDPYLSNALAEKYKDAVFKHVRMMPPPIRPDELRGVDFLLASHAHSDHMDPGSIGTIMAVNPDCVFICPRSARKTALERGADPDRLIHLSVLDKRYFGSLSIEAIPSAHEELADDGKGNPLFLGYIIDVDGIRIYHSGDCVPYPGLDKLLAERKVDVALLPVNGRRPELTEKGIIGNFSVEEAAELCANADIANLVPCHFGLFDFNTVAPETITERLEALGKLPFEYILPNTEDCIIAAETSLGLGETRELAATPEKV